MPHLFCKRSCVEKIPLFSLQENTSSLWLALCLLAIMFIENLYTFFYYNIVYKSVEAEILPKVKNIPQPEFLIKNENHPRFKKCKK